MFMSRRSFRRRLASFQTVRESAFLVLDILEVALQIPLFLLESGRVLLESAQALGQFILLAHFAPPHQWNAAIMLPEARTR